jgi:phenylpyruvate tautomerase PptA (4-oxalocrotonate tautomerase family)
MPSIIVDVRRTYTEAEEAAILQAVHTALVLAFKILPNRRNLILNCHKPHRFIGAPECEEPERLTNISLFVLRGRSVEAKRQLYKTIVDNLAPLGIPAHCILIKLHEMEPENVGVRGGQAVCDVDLGYSVNV